MEIDMKIAQTLIVVSVLVFIFCNVSERKGEVMEVVGGLSVVMLVLSLAYLSLRVIWL